MERTYNWIKGIIDSCVVDDHVFCCDLLIIFFEDKYKAATELTANLKLKRHLKWCEIHDISL